MNLLLRKVFAGESINLTTLLILIFSLGLGLASNQWILTHENYYDYFIGSVDPDSIEAIIDKTRDFNIVKAIWATISHFLSVLGTVFCLNLGCLYYNQKIPFKKLASISLVSSLIFLIPQFIKFAHFFTINDFSLSDYNSFYPGSLMFLVSSFDPFWIKSLFQIFNLFELLYILGLVIGISVALNCSYEDSFKTVFPSYFVGLLLWFTIKTFIQLTIFNFN